MWVCYECLAALKSHGERFKTVEQMYVDEDDEEQSKCKFCKMNGKDILTYIEF